LAAEKGHAESLFALAVARLTGEHVTRDLEIAARHLNEAAKRGHELAQCCLAALLIKEHHLEVPCPRSIEESVEIDNYGKAKEALLSVQHDKSALVIATEWLAYLQKHVEKRAMSPSIQARSNP
jgi:TPR repeat protein